jgi:hypothetical protein
MFILNLFANLMNREYLSELVSEPLAVLFFGIILFAATSLVRSFLRKQQENLEEY